jgi:hypothetical protein
LRCIFTRSSRCISKIKNPRTRAGFGYFIKTFDKYNASGIRIGIRYTDRPLVFAHRITLRANAACRDIVIEKLCGNTT